MITNSLLTQYSSDSVGQLISSGSISPRYDSGGNVLINYDGTTIFQTSVSVTLSSIRLDPIKIEEKYDVSIREFSVQ